MPEYRNYKVKGKRIHKGIVYLAHKRQETPSIIAAKLIECGLKYFDKHDPILREYAENDDTDIELKQAIHLFRPEKLPIGEPQYIKKKDSIE